VPLSEHEQRLFEQIERSLAEDSKFASAVRATDPRLHARRRVVVAGVLVLLGLGLVVYGAASQLPLLGVAGFVVALLGAAFGLAALRRGRTGELRAVDGRATRPTRTRRHSVLDRLEQRWRDRPEGQR
jgi:hypothetical protein